MVLNVRGKQQIACRRDRAHAFGSTGRLGTAMTLPTASGLRSVERRLIGTCSREEIVGSYSSMRQRGGMTAPE